MQRRAVVPIVLVGGGAAVAAALAPAAAGTPGAVAGSVHQAYRATPRKNLDGHAPANRQVAYRGPRLELGATYVGRDAAEPTVGVTGDGVAFFAAGAFDGPAGTARTEVRSSHDGGRTWRSVQRALPHDAGGMPPTTLDPYVHVDPATDRVFSVDLYGGCSFLSYSDDDGETWTDNPLACGVPVNDHQTLVTGPPPAGMPAPVGYPRYVYYCVNQVADVACGRSLDGGDSFQPAGAPAFTGIDFTPSGIVCGGLHGHAVTDRAGRLYLPKGHCERPWLAVSEDGGLTWRTSQVSRTIPAAGIQTAVAVDAEQNVYYAWWDPEDHLPYLAVSRDHGRTWGTPLMVAPPGVREVNFPSIDAAGRGRVALSFPGTTSGDRGDRLRPWNYYVVTSTDALEARPLFVSATANRPADPVHRGNCQSRCGGMFDFLDVVISPRGPIWAAAVDTCTTLRRCTTRPAVDSAAGMRGLAVYQLAGPGLRARRPAR